MELYKSIIIIIIIIIIASMHNVTDRQTDGRQYHANSRSHHIQL